MPKEMREYENQEMESNESPVPQVDDHLRLGLGQNGPAQVAVAAMGIGYH